MTNFLLDSPNQKAWLTYGSKYFKFCLERLRRSLIMISLQKELSLQQIDHINQVSR